MQPFLDAFPSAEVYGIDFDPMLLPLAQERLRHYGSRSRLILADLRSEAWRAQLPDAFDAVIRRPRCIGSRRLSWRVFIAACLFAPSWRFLCQRRPCCQLQPDVQKTWERSREEMRRAEAKQEGEDWEGFWERMRKRSDFRADVALPSACLAGGMAESRKVCHWHGILRVGGQGFSHPECFWRCDCDAIYGAFR